VIRTFDDATTRDVFYGEDSRAARRLPKELWSLIRRKLDALPESGRVWEVRCEDYH
jgi:hypothetical protein